MSAPPPWRVALPAWRGDLARLLAEDPELLGRVAYLFGYGLRSEALEKQPELQPPRPRDPEPDPIETPEFVVEDRPLVDVPFVQPTTFAALQPLTEVEEAQVAEDEEPLRPSPPEPQPLAGDADLDRRLRPALAQLRPTMAVNPAGAARVIAQARPVSRLPRRRRRRYGSRLQVILDRSSRLVPLWRDQDRLVRRLVALAGGSAIEIAWVHDTRCWPRLQRQGGDSDWSPPARGASVLVLGDLGVLDVAADVATSVWSRIGRSLLASGNIGVALVPAPLDRFPTLLRRLWRVVPWEGDGKWGTGDSVDRLLGLLAPAVRIEPGLVRDVRRAFPGEIGGVETECVAWQSTVVASRSSVAATLDPGRAKRLRAAFAMEPLDVRKRALREIHRWHAALPPEIWHEEVLSLDAATARDAVGEGDVRRAKRFFARLARDRREGGGMTSHAAVDAWLARAAARATGEAHGFQPFVDMVGRLTRNEGGFVPDSEIDPRQLVAAWGGSLRQLALAQRGSELLVFADQEPVTAASVLALLPSTTGHLTFNTWDSGEHPRADNDFWQSGTPPSWAADWGTDEYGAWVSFRVEGRDRLLEQRLRWLPPGRFLMGSPADEIGRFDQEDPQREVLIGEGFWLFATPVTQALYEAVTGENPSRLKGAERPVESVSWVDARKFLDRLNDRMPSLDLVLPSEAQWEYACRAGTTTATYAGDLPDLENAGAEVLDGIAWFDKNSGDETHPVALKTPNGWGLYDMLGNVFEWCAVHWHDSYEGAPSDGAAWLDENAEDSALRVFRGGSWNLEARYCRAASRLSLGPDARDDDLGFRPARGQGERSDLRGAVPAEAAWRGRSPASQPEAVAAQALRVVPGAKPQTIALPRAGAFRVRSDRAELTFRRLTKPEWTSGFGRDRFGLFAEITVDEVMQRLRWIPPGRFLMGSPAEEPGYEPIEGPQREVLIGEGYWLFATPVTQALYEAVTGGNPSEFKGADRPVENVSWDDAQKFLDRLNEQVSGLDLVLPSEAQWEYACRAGTTTATYAGDLPDLENAGARVLDGIAWFKKNSGNETHPVALKMPNGWGLYDMLGNVWEWCADHWHDSYEGAPSAGSAWLDENADPGALRVVRGGSWYDEARLCRAVFRLRNVPGSRNDYIGFRPARGQG